MKNITISILAILMFTLTACGGSSSGTQPASAPQDGSLPVQMQILIGTFKLEGTDSAVTAQQATQLLPLWQVYKDLSTSDTAAPEEIDGLIQQIQDAMTSDQMKAITDMNLTRQDMFTIMQDQGIAQAGSQGNGSRMNGQSGNGGGFTPPEGFVPPDGGSPGGFGGGEPGGFPGGGGNRQGDQSFSPEQIATAQAARGQGGGFNRLPPGLIDALIQFLEKKAGS